MRYIRFESGNTLLTLAAVSLLRGNSVMAGETILVVDDEQEIVQLIRLYLAREGYNVISANNGQEVFKS